MSRVTAGLFPKDKLIRAMPLDRLGEVIWAPKPRQETGARPMWLCPRRFLRWNRPVKLLGLISLGRRPGPAVLLNETDRIPISLPGEEADELTRDRERAIMEERVAEVRGKGGSNRLKMYLIADMVLLMLVSGLLAYIALMMLPDMLAKWRKAPAAAAWAPGALSALAMVARAKRKAAAPPEGPAAGFPGNAPQDAAPAAGAPAETNGHGPAVALAETAPVSAAPAAPPAQAGPVFGRLAESMGQQAAWQALVVDSVDGRMEQLPFTPAALPAEDMTWYIPHEGRVLPCAVLVYVPDSVKCALPHAEGTLRVPARAQGRGSRLPFAVTGGVIGLISFYALVAMPVLPAVPLGGLALAALFLVGALRPPKAGAASDVAVDQAHYRYLTYGAVYPDEAPEVKAKETTPDEFLRSVGMFRLRPALTMTPYQWGMEYEVKPYAVVRDWATLKTLADRLTKSTMWLSFAVLGALVMVVIFSMGK